MSPIRPADDRAEYAGIRSKGGDSIFSYKINDTADKQGKDKNKKCDLSRMNEGG